jgi:hypothetical protein
MSIYRWMMTDKMALVRNYPPPLADIPVFERVLSQIDRDLTR